MICPYAEFRTGLESVFEKCLESCDALELGAGWRWRRWPGRSLLPPAAPTAWRGCARSGACRYWRPSALATESVARHQAQHHRALARHAPALARRERPRRRRAAQPHHPAPGSLVSASRKHPSSGVPRQMDVQGKEGQLTDCRNIDGASTVHVGSTAVPGNASGGKRERRSHAVACAAVAGDCAGCRLRLASAAVSQTAARASRRRVSSAIGQHARKNATRSAP